MAISLTTACAAATKEISFLTTGYPSALLTYVQQEVVPEFRRQYDTDVVVLTAGWNDRMEKILVMTAGVHRPDVIVTGTESPYVEGSAGLLEPLNRYLALGACLRVSADAVGCSELAEVKSWPSRRI